MRSSRTTLRVRRAVEINVNVWVDRSAFENTSKWIEDVRTERGQDVVIMLVGNKTDLEERRQVTVEEGAAKAKEENTDFMETSAKVGQNVKSLFSQLAKKLPGIENVTEVSDSPCTLHLVLSLVESDKWI